ncbi:hypothetical protein BDZ94DRAFT_1278105 [Collybia nuda]|uniref:Uncharacterized protein n=1 Tax=Collybia nuda TaxID=64659 RepID=A0A9P6C821_9AGAR|nr:hypothetical protein BDZ94DRAFT_1278105 [Collybia nuda]
MGALMGGGVGLTIGFIFGSWSIIRSSQNYPHCFVHTDHIFRGGAGPRGFLATLSQYMLSSAATFSFFLAIGSVSKPSFPRCNKKLYKFAPGHSYRFTHPASSASRTNSTTLSCT